MLHEVEQYFETARVLREQYTTRSTAVYDEMRAAGVSSQEGQERLRALGTFRDVSVEAAWKLMGALSGDAMVKWVVSQFGMDGERRDLRLEAEAVLGALPSDAQGLRDFANDKGWCEAFDRHLEDAIAAGAISDGPVVTPWQESEPVKAALGELNRWVAGQVMASSGQRERLRELVLAVASAAREGVLERAAQYLDADAQADVAGSGARDAVVEVLAGEGSVPALDISTWPEWESLRTVASREMSPAHLDTFKSLVTEIAVWAANNGVEGVEVSREARALKGWVESIGGAARLSEVRSLMEPIVRRAAR